MRNKFKKILHNFIFSIKTKIDLKQTVMVMTKKQTLLDYGKNKQSEEPIET